MSHKYHVQNLVVFSVVNSVVNSVVELYSVYGINLEGIHKTYFSQKCIFSLLTK